MEEWKKELASIKTKIKQSEIKDIKKTLPFLKTGMFKIEIINLEKLEDRRDFDREREQIEIYNGLQQLRKSIF